MSNNPSPTRAQLFRESDAERLISQHLTETKAFHCLIQRTVVDLRRLNFELGSPSKRFDIEDIEAMLTDSLEPQDAEWLEMAADALAQKMERV